MSETFRFGDFEFNPSAYELRGLGNVSIKLERLAMEALIRLISAPGLLVPREELRAALWPADVFIDEEAAINTVVRKVRRALGDDADHPRFIETVVGKGYRFIAPVVRHTTGPSVTEASDDPSAPGRTDRQDPGRLRSKPVLVSLGAVLAVVVAARLWISEWTASNLASAAPAHLTASPNRPVLPAAYDAYVRGRYAWNKRTEADLREAVRWFRASLDADPTYAAAYVGLSDSYSQLGYGSYVAPDESFPLAREAARRALELDPSLADAHAALGFALMYYDWNFAAADAEFLNAMALKSDYAVAHQWRAYLLTARERPLEEAEREIDEARRLDPLSVAIHTDRAYILHYYGRDVDALRSVNLALEMNPRFPLGHFWRGRIYTQIGRYADAEAAFAELGPFNTWTPALAARGYLSARARRTADARRMLAEFAGMARDGRYASSYALAVVYAGLGDRERVLASLEAAYSERSHWLVWLKRDPRLAPFRGDPRFAALVRRIGLPALTQPAGHDER